MQTTWAGAPLQKRRENRKDRVSAFPHQAAFLLDNPLRRRQSDLATSSTSSA